MLEPGTLIGKYVVRRKIAEGGMAEIYLCALHGPEGFEKDVVIKRIRPMFASDATFVQMFINEARLVSRLNHPNLVQILDFDKHEDTYYLAMEYVRGRSLWELRRRTKELMQPLPPTLAAHIVAQVARGLAHAHAASDKGQPLGLVHRDVTPHNVLLSFDGAVKLIDFGVAKHSASVTHAGVLKGKFAYMSPEQARGEPVDARTDLFALGIVLWELLTGGRLFEGDADVAVLRAVQTSAIPPPSRLNPEVPPALSELSVKALQRDPNERFQTGAQMERALQQFVLSHAKSLDDTDLSAHLRRLFPEEDATKIATSPGAQLPPTSLERSPPPRRAPPAADEDAHASTLAPAPAPDTRPLSAPNGLQLTVGMRRALWGGLGTTAAIALGSAVLFVGQPPPPPVISAEPAAAEPAAPREVPAILTNAVVPASDPAPPPRPPEGPPGTLLLKIRPYAAVSIDGKYLRDVEGVGSFRLPPGPHVVKLQHPRGTKELPVVIRSGKQTAVDQTFIR